MALAQSPYLVVPKACENPRVRLVCFPHSGGAASQFSAWGERLAEKHIEIVAVAPPGRERRIDEEVVTDWRVLVNDVCEALKTSGVVDGCPYAFLGHSLGAIIAYEVAQKLQLDLVPGRPRPIHIFASAHATPSTAGAARASMTNGDIPWGSLHTLDDDALVGAVSKFGFLPEDVTANKDLLALVMPALRADFQVYETYAYEAGREQLAVPITPLGGLEDASMPVEQLSTWADQTSEFREPQSFPGGHFFIDSSFDQVVNVVAEHVEESLAKLPLSLLKSRWEVPEICETTLLQDVFLQRAAETPDAEAVVDDHERLTYKELASRAELLAMHLQANFLEGKAGEVVALSMGHDVTYVTAMLAIWMAGAKFLVIETHFNPELCKEICEESNAKVAIANAKHAAKFEGINNCKTLLLNEDWPKKLRTEQFRRLEEQHTQTELPKAHIHDISILMMTSGTTGRPKTIAGSNYFMHLGQQAKAKLLPYTEEDDREAFNVMFVWEVLRPLLWGKTAFVLPDDSVLDTNLFVASLEKHQCTRVLTTPSLLATILQYSSKDIDQRLYRMRTWLTCGEVLPMSTVRKFRDLLPQCKLVNDYSSWEAADAAYAIVSPAPAYEPSSAYAAAGEIAPGIVVVVVDPDTKKLVPKGIAGELYLGGPALSSGYYLKPEATAEKFVDGFTEEMRELWQGKWYKSGDFGRIIGDPGLLELRGRMDSTVKIRGFKIGMPVVEGALAQVTGVGLAAVVPVHSAPGIVDSLVCFLRPQDGVDFGQLLVQVKQEGPKKMPRWMMPSTFKPMPEEALGGGEARKLDRKKLTKLAQEAFEQERVESTSSEAESDDKKANIDVDGISGVVRKVWAKSLNLSLQHLDLEENFFDLGGHSTLAVQIAAELANDYGLKVSVLDIYSNSTLGELLNFLDPEGSSSVLATTVDIGMPRAAPDMKEGLAIVGMAGKFPGADDIDAFWENLRQGAVSATFLTKEFLMRKGLAEDVIDNKEFVPCAYLISDVDKFDHNLFGIGRHEAALMDPQHRTFIEATWAALENAALSPKVGLSNTVVGVFAAAGIDGYLAHHLDGLPLKDSMEPGEIFLAEIGNEKDYIATRVSYLLNFTGPSMNVNSACSSALVACAQAASAITAGQCDAAIAGASSITFPNLGYRYQDGLVNSVDGYVRPFDAAADGTVFGDAVGAVVLRRKEDVSNDLIWGMAKGFSVSNDGGRKAGYAAPSSAGQAQAIRHALQMMGESPWSLSYVECHATGTRVGDGIEIRGLTDAFKQVGGAAPADASIAIGSVKGNIAHANCAAGVTGLAKLLLMMRSRELVPTANFKNLNAKIDIAGTPFHVNEQLCRWDAGDKPLRAGVSSFGIGGTNAHMVVEEPPQAKIKEGEVAGKRGVWSYQVFPFSAKSSSALHRGAVSMAKGLQKLPEADLGDVAFTLQTGRAELPLRKSIIVKVADGKAVEVAAESIQRNMPDEEELEEIEDAVKRPSVAFVFPGQGSQYFGMARGLYEQVPLFCQAIDQCCDLLAAPERLGRDLRPLLFPSVTNAAKEFERQEEFARPSVLQPALFMIEYSLAQVFLAVGVAPVATGGHSLGEYAAAVVGGLLSLEAACGIVAARSQSTETLAEDGSMLSVAEWSQEELDAVNNGQRPGLWLAAVNSPVHAVVSGETAAIEALDAELKAAGRKSTKLPINKAFHSGLIAKAADTLKGLGMPQEDGTKPLPIAANLTGGWMTAEQLKEGSYWTKHMRGAVLWRDNADKILRELQPAIIIELGPGNALTVLTKKCVKSGATPPAFMNGMRHPKATGTHDVEALLTAVGQLWEKGCTIDWHALHTKVLGVAAEPRAMRLPTYGFDPVSLWVNPERSAYVDSTDNPCPAQYHGVSTASSASTATPKSPEPVSPLVKFGEREGPEPAIKAYCLPFASGSSLLFAPWAETADTAIEVIAFELPQRGGRSDEFMPGNDAEDAALLDSFCDAIIADLKGAQYVLVGFSMGGNLSVEMCMRLAARGAQLPLALYVAGRKPPAEDPDTVGRIDMTNAELAQYAFAPPEVASTPEFVEFVVPLLRADLELDARVEKRLGTANLSGQKLPPNVGLELFCGTNDDVAPWMEAQNWQRFTQVYMGLHYYPGGHEFMRECRHLILAIWRRDAINRLVQRRTAELAFLSAQGFSAPGTILTPALLSTPAANAAKEKLPMYAVRWVAATPSLSSTAAAAPNAISLNLNNELMSIELEQAVKALQSNGVVVAVCPPTEGVLSGPLDAEVGSCWQFIRLVQHVLEAGAGGRMVVLSSAAATGAMVAGASKAVAMEAGELKIQRVFVPPEAFVGSPQKLISAACELATRCPDDTDLWIQDKALVGPAYTPRLDQMLEPSAKLACVPKFSANGEEATYVLTGATGGLGSAVVEWLIKDQGLNPEQLVLLRRAGSRALSGDLAKCQVVEVSSVDSEDALVSSRLRELRGISGVFHLAGVLDDGIVQGMTEERYRSVAQPKCGMLLALIKAATTLQWPLQWVLGFSSTSSLFGYAGQSNYCAANAMLDHLATFGASPDVPEGDKLPCRFIAVNWGPWGEAGMAKVGTKAYEQAVKEGDTPLSTKTALRCLASALRIATQAQPAAVQFCACDVEWSKSQWADLPILDLVHDRASASTHPVALADGAASSREGAQNALKIVQDFLVQHTKGGSWKRVQSKALHQLGLDSLETVQVRNAFNKTFSLNVPLAVFADASSNVSDIAETLSKQISPPDDDLKKGFGSSAASTSSKLQDFMVQHTKGSSWKRIQSKTLHQLGLDSLELVQLRNSFNKAFGVTAPLKLIADASQNVASITEALGQLVTG